MGLDMYLSAKRYVSGFAKEDEAVGENIKEMFPELKNFGATEQQLIREVSIRAGYWRKANQIHKWFVDNVQDGTDNCGNYYVSREHLEELKKLCQQVIDFRHLATDKLPPSQGFFFGNDKVDDYYFDDLQQTIQIINECLTLPNSWEFEYHSSW